MIRTARYTIYENFHKKISIQRKIINENNFTYRVLLGVINNFLESSGTILDIGCGVGTVSLYLASKGKKVIGIDISKNAIYAAERSAKFLNFRDVYFKIMDFPYETPQGKYDLIICSEVLEHLKDDNFAFKKIYSLLKSNGIVIISVPSKNAPLYKLGLAKEFDKRVGHLRRYTLRELVGKCQRVGFTILETRKTEGVLRNFLFLNPVAGKLIRFIKFFISDIVSFLDWISLQIFGESQIFIVAKKP